MVSAAARQWTPTEPKCEAGVDTSYQRRYYSLALDHPMLSTWYRFRRAARFNESPFAFLE